jgi:twitching motility protein PilT
MWESSLRVTAANNSLPGYAIIEPKKGIYLMADAGKAKHQRLGAMLVQQGLVSVGQLEEALKVQSQSGGHIGSILMELGHIDIDHLLEVLGKQLGVTTVNLYELTIPASVLSLLPFTTMKKYEVLPVSVGERGINLGMVNPTNFSALSDLQFILGRNIQFAKVPAIQMSAALAMLEKRGGRLDKPIIGAELKKIHGQAGIDLPDIKELFRKLIREKASDLLLTAGAPPCLKKDNELKRLSTSFLSPQQIKIYAYELIPVDQRGEFEQERELDFALTFPDLGRFRINVYRQRNSISIAVRHIVEAVPSLSELGLPAWIEEFALRPHGLILITGPTGHGKTTTLAAVVDIINNKRRCNIITIEDPVEYLHKHKKSNVNQREVGVDTESFRAGLRHIVRQAPDVIVIGEMRDAESFEIALQAAETGHLVVSTLHSSSATSTIERIIDISPRDKQLQVRFQVADSFLLILNQRLVPLKKGAGRALVYEKLANSYRVKNLIREGKTHQIRSMLQQSSDDYSSIDHSLARLCKEGKVALEVAMKFCDNPSFFQEMVQRP